MPAVERLVARLRAPQLDRALAAGASPESSGPMATRARALTRLRNRGELAVSLRRLAHPDVGPSTLGSRLRGSSHRVGGARDDLERLAQRLVERRPVNPQGVALTRELLADGTGPLFWGRSGEDLTARLRAALEALEPLRP